MKTFSTSAFRSFKRFIGELTAVAAGIYVGVQEALPVVEQLGTTDPWEVAAKKYGLVLSGLKSQRVVESSVRLNLVSLYSGFDLFVADIRSQFHLLHGIEWRQHDGDTPFDALARNTPSKPGVHLEKLGAHRIAALDYYRLIRNAIAHPNPEALESAKKFFETKATHLAKARAEYGMQSAPNEIERLSFHDLKFLARVALDLADSIDEDFDPGDEKLAKLLPMEILKRPKSFDRNRNALVGWLHENYGIQTTRAENIIAQALNDSSA
ncbi:hypothetical protein [Paracidovorax wautersii]|uniref:hypothetical protein n=1 Tax=Paracidovorax wautersii TaxID=1177982 RepID=UPI0031DA8A9D